MTINFSISQYQQKHTLLSKKTFSNNYRVTYEFRTDKCRRTVARIFLNLKGSQNFQNVNRQYHDLRFTTQIMVNRKSYIVIVNTLTPARQCSWYPAVFAAYPYVLHVKEFHVCSWYRSIIQFVGADSSASHRCLATWWSCCGVAQTKHETDISVPTNYPV